MRTLVICHDGASLDREGLVRWLGSFTTVAGTLVIKEPGGRVRRRIAREITRVGVWRFLDVLAFRAYYKLAQAAGDRRWERRALDHLRMRFPDRPESPELVVGSPNSKEAEAFIREQKPDLVIARCKTLLSDRIFTIPRLGTYVMHPGICPEYRNAHGCFWAMASGDWDYVGMTMLRIDKGVDTGPVYGYFRIEADPHESHTITQHRVVLDHLEAIRTTLLAIEAGTATSIDTTGRKSAAWGQPWLSALLRMRRSWRARSDGARAFQASDVTMTHSDGARAFPPPLSENSASFGDSPGRQRRQASEARERSGKTLALHVK